MSDSYYFSRIYTVLENIFTLLQDMSSDVEKILITVTFFCFLWLAYNFISKRWLVLNG